MLVAFLVHGRNTDSTSFISALQFTSLPSRPLVRSESVRHPFIPRPLHSTHLLAGFKNDVVTTKVIESEENPDSLPDDETRFRPIPADVIDSIKSMADIVSVV